jgi:DNA mismatch endonuclease, patch repair protein
MQANRRRDTTPELAIRRLLHRSGRRYRVDYAIATSEGRVRVDIAFPGRRLAVFIDGCYWHGCPAHATTPKRNREYWVNKIAENRRRDERQADILRRAGWVVLRIWEHEDPTDAAEVISHALAAVGQSA